MTELALILRLQQLLAESMARVLALEKIVYTANQEANQENGFSGEDK
jgi:hypothetical protein